MICRTCLRRAAGLAARPIAGHPLARTSAALPSIITGASPAAAPSRSLTTTLPARNAAPSPAAAAPAAAAAAAAESTSAPPNLTPIPGETKPQQQQQQTPISSCPAGTVLNGLNYFKGKSDPVALPDEEYPEWLWRCLEVQKKTDSTAETDAGDEFSKSKKQRRLALKRQRAAEARMLATGDLEALVPKVPLQKQSVNLPAAEPGNVAQAIEAHDQREELRRAMRKERRAKIKETNYLKAM
ncbi:hypothetical protein VTJ83DRAFT_2184 [Remersonia thermophila]|uniref:Large ribosomal subunit protein mL54 n=1 Tax=Remersonia thermophila TaxID=72144 RepID=A0ABR4DIM8_9PEZI